MDLKLRDILQISHGKWSQDYMVTTLMFNGYIAKRTSLPKTKADARRFPIEIEVTIFPNALFKAIKKA